MNSNGRLKKLQSETLRLISEVGNTNTNNNQIENT